VAVVLQLVRRRLPAAAVQPALPTRRPGGAWASAVHEFRAVAAKPWARVVLVTAFFEGAAVYGPFAFVASHLHLRLGLPLSTVGAMVMGFALGGLAFALNARLLVQRLGEVLLVRIGSAFMASAFVTIALAPNAGWAVAACLLMGLGFYMMHNTLQTHATQMAPERRGAAVAAFAACFFLGQSVGVAIAGLVVGRTGSGWVLGASAIGLLAVAWGFNRQRGRVLRGGFSAAT